MATGTPAEYKDHYPDLAFELFSKHDYTVAAFAKHIGVHHNSVYRWRVKHPEFKMKMDMARDLVVIEQIEQAMLNSARGRWETVYKEKRDGKGEIKETEKTIRWVPGNPIAQQFILMNLAPDRWRSVKSIDFGAQDGREIEFNIKIGANDETQEKEDSSGLYSRANTGIVAPIKRFSKRDKGLRSVG